MLLTLPDARRIADDAISKEHANLEVLGVTTSEGGSRYTEVIMRIRGCHAEPCQVVIGVDRDVSESTFREEVVKGVRQHLEQQSRK